MTECFPQLQSLLWGSHSFPGHVTALGSHLPSTPWAEASEGGSDEGAWLPGAVPITRNSLAIRGDVGYGMETQCQGHCAPLTQGFSSQYARTGCKTTEVLGDLGRIRRGHFVPDAWHCCGHEHCAPKFSPCTGLRGECLANQLSCHDVFLGCPHSSARVVLSVSSLARCESSAESQPSAWPAAELAAPGVS